MVNPQAEVGEQCYQTRGRLSHPRQGLPLPKLQDIAIRPYGAPHDRLWVPETSGESLSSESMRSNRRVQLHRVDGRKTLTRGRMCATAYRRARQMFRQKEESAMRWRSLAPALNNQSSWS